MANEFEMVNGKATVRRHFGFVRLKEGDKKRVACRVCRVTLKYSSDPIDHNQVHRYYHYHDTVFQLGWEKGRVQKKLGTI